MAPPDELDVPDDLRTYVTQHHGYLTQACRHHDQLGLPLTWEGDDGRAVTPEASMELFRLTVATHVHPDVISWWGTYSLGCLSTAREFATRRGKEELEPLVRLIERDVESFRRAGELFAAQPDDIQQLVRTTGAQNARLVLALYSSRLVVSLPGAVLLAWQAEWHDALVAFHSVFGGSPPPASAEVASITARLEATEEANERIRRQLRMAASALDPTLDEPDDGSGT